MHLANKDELQGYAELFPQGGIGVAQGSSLSAFAGNVLLYEMDHKLNDMGVTAVRYIDDILMVASAETLLDSAIKHAEAALTSFGFGLYTPVQGSDKAARGECSNAINFLGCTIQPKRCVPSAASITRLKEGVTKSLSDSKSAIKEALRTKKSLHQKLSRTGTLDSIGKKIYGWQKAFAFCTDDQPFEQLDDFVGKQISDYEAILGRMLGTADQTTRMMVVGIPSMQAMFLVERKPRTA
jgi:hypothetical protein